MAYQFSNNGFEPNHFIKSLIIEMGFEHSDPDKKQTLESAIERQMMDVILNTASLHLAPEEINYVVNNYHSEEDPTYFIRQLIKNSPNAQLAILEALDEFYLQTIDAYKTLKK